MKSKINSAISNSMVPFEEIISHIHFRRDPSYAPLFQYMFAMQNFAMSDIDMGGVKITMDEPDTAFVKFDITLTMCQFGDKMRGRAEYDCDLFSEQFIDQFFKDFVFLLEAMITDDSLAITEIRLRSGEQNELSAENIEDSLF